DLSVIQDRIGRAVAEVQSLVTEVKTERPFALMSAPDPAPLPRTLLRLRHDFVMIGRASSEPFPPHSSEALKPVLDRLAAAVGGHFRACAVALRRKQAPPPLTPLQATLADCTSRIAGLRQSEAARLSASQLEHLFALEFVLDQLERNICDLERCI